MSHDLVISLVALALIGACALFVLSTAVSDEERERRSSEGSARRAGKEAARSEASTRRAEKTALAAEKRAEKTARTEKRKAVLAERAAQRRAERAAYAEQRRAEKAARAIKAGAQAERSAPEAPVKPPWTTSSNGQGIGPAIETPAGATTRGAVEAAVGEKKLGFSLGPAVAHPVEALPASAGEAPVPAAVVAAEPQRAASVAVDARERPRIFTGEPAPIEHGPPVSKRALKLLGGMTALAAVGAVGLLAVVRAVAAMFGR